MPTLNAEYRLLLLCCKKDFTGEQFRDQVEALVGTPNFDWNSFLEIVAFHRIFPLVYKKLTKCKECLPAKIVGQLGSLYQVNCAKNLLLTGHLIRVCKLLEVNNIVAVPFKGPALSQLIYSDVCSRSFMDLDILVSKKDLKSAVTLLVRNGYGLDTNLSVDYYLELVNKHYHANLVNNENGISIELHWEISGRYLSPKIELEFLQSRLESVEINGVKLVSIGKEDLLMYLCVHGNRHCWTQLEFVCCLAAFLQKNPDLDWPLTYKIAHQVGAEHIVTLGLMLVESCCGVGTKAIFAEKAEWRQLIKIKGDIERALLSPLERINEEQLQGHRLFFHYHTLARKRDGLRYCIRKFCVPDVYDVNWLPLPQSFLSLFVIFRPIRFFVLFVKSLLKSSNFKKNA